VVLGTSRAANPFASSKKRRRFDAPCPLINLMMGEGRLVKLKNHRLIHSESIDEIKRILKEHIEKRGQVALGESMEILGIGRTQALPIFEYLDSIQFTMRVGDYRVQYKSVEKGDKYNDKYKISINDTHEAMHNVNG
jgi:hypothetical protein